MKQLRVQSRSSKPYGDVFTRGNQRGRRANKPSLPALNLPPHLPCKNESRECAPDGSCLRCGACQGSACRPPPESVL